MEINNTKDLYDYSLGAVPDIRVRELPILNLAYIGDTVYDLYIRGYLVKNNMGMVQSLHKLASGIVNARAQAEAARMIVPSLSEREGEIFSNGKNAKSSPTKNMSREDYSQATGLEAVIGYLYLTGNSKRIDELFRIIINFHFGRGQNA